jgi:hypothetical protein
MTKPKNDISRDDLIELLLYDPITGLFVWRYSRSGRVKQYEPAGIIDARGYRAIGFKGRLYAAHRLAWLYMYGRWPKEEIDHINMDRADNRINNLREATRSQNLHNGRARKQNTHGTKGITKHKYKGKFTGKWTAQISRNKIHHYLGIFNSAADAHKAYCEAAEEFYGQFARTK